MKISYLADHPHESSKIAQWYFDEWGHTFPGTTIEKVNKSVSKKALSKSNFPLAFVIHEKDDLVAVAELKIRENKYHPEYEHWLGGVFVSSAHRGQGYASALISRAKDHAAELGIKKLYLQCEEHNIDLYSRHGFEILHKSSHGNTVTTIMAWEVNE